MHTTLKSIRVAVLATVAVAAATVTSTLPANAATAKAARFSVSKPYAAPELVGLKNWVNSAPQTIGGLRGKVVIVNFWTFGCINCQRTLPQLRKLYAKYHAQGLEIIGVHAPEFGYEKDAKNVQNAVQKDAITWPVAQDNDFSTWNQYRNQFWPAFYFIDKAGKVRNVHEGEGSYANNDRVVAALLAE